MNTITKQIIGAVIGAFVGNFVSQVVIEYIRYVEAPLQEEDWLDGNENDPTVVEEIKFEKIAKENPVVKKGTRTRSNVKNYTEYFISQERPDLAALAAKYNGDPLPEEKVDDAIGGVSEIIMDDINDELMEDVLEDQAEFDSMDPSVISLEEYANDDELQHVTLNYYNDDVVTDEDDNPIDRPEHILGEDALVSFGELSQDEDVVYVRNLKKKAMYEVVRLDKSYGVPEPKPRRMRPEYKEEDYAEDNS